MKTDGEDWTAEQIEQLHQGWTIEKKSLQQIGREMGRSKNAINGKLNRMREKEGEEKWPKRPTPIQPNPDSRWARRKRMRRVNGRNTLPPLSSMS